MADKRVPLPSGKPIKLGDCEYIISGEPIGRGASCLVYEAEKQGQNKHLVIIKEFNPKDADKPNFNIEAAKARFRQGVKYQVHFYEKNPNNAMMGYPEVYEANGTLYSIIGYAAGDSGDAKRATLDKCREGKTLCEIAQIIWSLCTAVADFHSENLLYLDIKPENLFLYAKHNTYRVGFFDFDSMLPDTDETREGSFRPLSELWCPPEQKLWNASLGKATDIFAIGAVLYWLISGKEAGEDWLREVDERVQQDILGECPKLRGFANATETAKKVLFATLASEVSERTKDIGEIAVLAKVLEELAGEYPSLSDEMQRNFNEVFKEFSMLKETIESLVSVQLPQSDHKQIEMPTPKDITRLSKVSYRFTVALSFAGESREIVSLIASKLSDAYGKDKILYDDFLAAEFARWNLSNYLPQLYRNDSELIVVFVDGKYNEKSWCGLEWRAIQDLLLSDRANEDRVMFINVGEGNIDGFFGRLDGQIKLSVDNIDDVIGCILERQKIVSRNTERMNRHPLRADNASKRSSEELYEFALCVPLGKDKTCIDSTVSALIDSWFWVRNHKKFSVTIFDERKKYLENRFNELDQQLNNRLPTDIVIKTAYSDCVNALLKLQSEYELKKCAIELFLSDEYIKGCLHISKPKDIKNMIEKILMFSYYEQSVILNDKSNISLTIRITSEVDLPTRIFTASVDKELAVKCFNKSSKIFITRKSLSVIEADVGLQIQIAIYYLFFLAQLKILSNFDITTNNCFLNFSQLCISDEQY